MGKRRGGIARNDLAGPGDMLHAVVRVPESAPRERKLERTLASSIPKRMSGRNVRGGLQTKDVHPQPAIRYGRCGPQAQGVRVVNGFDLRHAPPMRCALIFGVLGLAACAPVKPTQAPGRSAPAEVSCTVWGMPGAICPGDPVRLKMCSGRTLLIFADGREERMPNSYFNGGFEVAESKEKVPACPDGSRPKFFQSPTDAEPK